MDLILLVLRFCLPFLFVLNFSLLFYGHHTKKYCLRMARFCSPRHVIVPSFSKRQSSKFTDIINKTGNEPLSWEITQWIFDFPLVSLDGFLISAVAFVSQVAWQFEVKLSICVQIQKEYHVWHMRSVFAIAFTFLHCDEFSLVGWVFKGRHE